MKTPTLSALVAGALMSGAGTAALAQADYNNFRITRGPDWNLSAAEGACRLRISVDDRARVQMRGDEIIVRTESGRRSYDRGSVCNQPLPFHRVEDFRVAVERGRGAVFDVEPPNRRNNFTGAVTVDDPQNGDEDYEIVVSWRTPERLRVAPLAAADPYPYFDEVRACQDRVRGDFIARNRETDGYLEFTSVPVRDEIGPNRERIRGEAWARNRVESRTITYECVMNERTNRVVTSSYEVLPRARLGYAR